MKLRTLNFIILTSAVVVFVGAGCGQTSKNEVTSSVNVGNQVIEEEGETAANLEEEAEETVTEESVEAIDASGWLTYENEEYGFSFRYPIDAKLVENEKSLPYPGISFLSDITVDNTKKEDLQGITTAFAVTDLDLTALTQKIEQSDTSRGITLTKVGSIQEGTLNQFTVYQGSHTTAIGIPKDFYYIPLKSNFALFIFYNSDKNNVNSDIINTLSIEN